MRSLLINYEPPFCIERLNIHIPYLTLLMGQWLFRGWYSIQQSMILSFVSSPFAPTKVVVGNKVESQMQEKEEVALQMHKVSCMLDMPNSTVHKTMWFRSFHPQVSIYRVQMLQTDDLQVWFDVANEFLIQYDTDNSWLLHIICTDMAHLLLIGNINLKNCIHGPNKIPMMCSHIYYMKQKWVYGAGKQTPSSLAL